MKKILAFATMIMMVLVAFSASPLMSADDEEMEPMDGFLTLRPDGDLDGFMTWSPLAPIYNYDEVYETGSHDGFSSYVYTDVAEFYNYDFYTVENHTDETEVIESVTLRGVFNDNTPSYADSAVCLSIGNGTGRLPDIVASDSLGLGPNGWGELEWTFDSDPYGYSWTWDMVDQMFIGINVTYLGTAEFVMCTQLWAEVNYISGYGDPTTFPDAKMHFPQYPDPYGLDVYHLDFGYLADDWMCNSTGDVTDIHFWISWYQDMVGYLPEFNISVWSNNPGPPSTPNQLLWLKHFSDMEFTVSEPYYGEEGWYEYPNFYEEYNHEMFFRIDIENITDPFYQENGTIYWLVIDFPNQFGGPWSGWKTSQDHFMDNAVYSPDMLTWHPLFDPREPMLPIDFAFVITGETEEEEQWPDAKMHYPQLPDPNGWDVLDFYEYDQPGLNEGFEDGFPPSGWANTGWQDSLYGDPHSGSHWAYSWAEHDELTTPTLTFGENTELTFWYRAESVNHPMQMEVQIDDTDIVWSDYGYTHIEYEQITVDLSGYTGEHTISFENMYSDFYGMLLDDIVVTTDNNEYLTVLADDWMCTETGNVTGIHWWGSWREDVIDSLNGFDVAIFSDLPEGESPTGYSMPDESLWHQYVSIQQLNITEEEPSLQGWYDPYPSDPSIIEDDHTMYFRYDFENITEPFHQESGTIYWLSVVANISGVEGHGEWGWKTSISPQWNDACVGVFEPQEPPHDWIFGSTWSQAEDDAGFTSGRYNHGSVVFDDKMWVIGGFDGDGNTYNDTWYSTDGITWTQANNSAGWSPRGGMNPVIYDNKIWIIGGYDVSGVAVNDTWYSTDGVNWICVGSNDALNRVMFTSEVFDDKMWVIGGYASDWSGILNDTWYSTDGITWTQATANAEWVARYNLESVVFDDKMWVMGGSDGSSMLNDTWYSTDGITWTQATANAEWSGRYQFPAIAYNDKMYVIGGQCDSNAFNDVWYSTDGVTWYEITESAAPWEARTLHTLLVYNNKLWIILGQGIYGMNDVWYSTATDWINISEPYTDEKLDLAFVITGETVEPEPEPTIFYVDQQYNASTPGWHVTHWNTIHEAVENASAGHTIFVNGDGDIYSENVYINKSINVEGNYTISRPRINGQHAFKSTVEIMSDWVNFSGFYVYNNVGKANSYHCIAVGFMQGVLENYYNVTISDCYISTAASGVLIRGGYCTVETSEFPTGLDNGIQTLIGAYNIIRYCDIYDIQTGIYVSTSSAFNSIYGNTINRTTSRGIYLNGHITNGNYIYNNNITNNPIGITVASGRVNNWIYHNNFISNTAHVNFVNNANLNFWNLSYPYCGNYWSGHGTQDIYGGPDQDIIGSDLICDLHSPDPYTVGGVNIDNYPFLNPFNGTLPSFSYLPVQSNEVPANGTTQNVSTARVMIDVNDTEGDAFDIRIHGDYLFTNVSLNGQTNRTLSAPLLPEYCNEFDPDSETAPFSSTYYPYRVYDNFNLSVNTTFTNFEFYGLIVYGDSDPLGLEFNIGIFNDADNLSEESGFTGTAISDQVWICGASNYEYVATKFGYNVWRIFGTFPTPIFVTAGQKWFSVQSNDSLNSEDLAWMLGLPGDNYCYQDRGGPGVNLSYDVAFRVNSTSAQLPYDTDIWWYVDIFDSESRWINASYYFHTELQPNSPPNKPSNETPANNSDYVLINSYLSVTVTDPEGDVMDVIFYWANGTEIGVDWTVTNGSTASIYLPDYVWLSHNTEYSWYVVVYDTSLYSNTSDIWNFTTCKNYDLNGNGVVNYLDVSMLVAHYGAVIPDAAQMITLRPIMDTIVTWATNPPLPAHFSTVMEIIPDDMNTYVFENPPAMGPELFFVNAPSYTYSIINVTLNARMSSLVGMGTDIFQHVIWDGFAPLSYDVPVPIMTPFPIFQTYPSSTWIGDPYGGDWTWAKLQTYHFGVDQTGVPFMSPTMMTQFYLDVHYTTPGSEPYDINGDGIVNYLDVSAMVSHYGEHY